MRIRDDQDPAQRAVAIANGPSPGDGAMEGSDAHHIWLGPTLITGRANVRFQQTRSRALAEHRRSGANTSSIDVLLVPCPAGQYVAEYVIQYRAPGTSYRELRAGTAHELLSALGFEWRSEFCVLHAVARCEGRRTMSRRSA